MAKSSHRMSEGRDVSLFSLFCLLALVSVLPACACLSSLYVGHCIPSGSQPFCTLNILLPYMVTLFTREVRSRGCADRRHPKRLQQCGTIQEKEDKRKRSSRENREKRSVLIGRRLDGASRDRYAYCKSCEHLWCENCIE